MIKLIDILREIVEDLEIPQEAYTGKVYSNSSNIWTHVSRHDEIIEDIKKNVSGLVEMKIYLPLYMVLNILKVKNFI